MNKVFLNKQEIKEELLAMMNYLSAFLQKNNIRYSIIAGTLLGAVRHKGFIPRDDDIDIAIPREDYNKLISLYKNNKDSIEKKYSFLGGELDTLDVPFLKFVNNKIYCERLDKNGFTEDNNLWIDIFPVDGVPKKHNRLFYFFVHKIYRRVYLYKRYEHNNWSLGGGKFKQLLRDTYMFPFKRHTLIDVIKWYVKKCSKYPFDCSDNVNVVIWGIGKKEEFKKHYFDDIIDYQFENTTLKGFKSADEWLTNRYGNYMTMPSKNERVCHDYNARRECDEE